MTTQVSSRHPLLEKKIVGIASWEQWLERWRDVTTAEELISLLHYGFDASGNVYAKAAFYLSIADGHADWQGRYMGHRADDIAPKYSGGMMTSLRRPGPHHECEYSSAELRALIAAKAWKVLCVRFFGEWAKNQGSAANPGWFCYWGERDEDLGLLKLLFDFLDPKHGSNNLSARAGHHREVFEVFMRGFIETAWEQRTVSSGWTGRPYSEKEKTCKAISALCRESRPRLMNMISVLGWEAMFLKLSLDEQVLSHLEAQVAAWIKTKMRVESLEEAATRDCESAKIYLLLKNRIKVEKMKMKKKPA